MVRKLKVKQGRRSTKTKLAGPVEFRDQRDQVGYALAPTPETSTLSSDERFELESLRREAAYRSLTAAEESFRNSIKALGGDYDQAWNLQGCVESLVGALIVVHKLN
jgi:hypothetical protein